MADKSDARVSIGVEGAAEVAAAADRALRPWTNAATAAQSAMGGFGRAVGDVVRQTTSDISRIVTAYAGLDFASRIPGVIQYREEVARLSVVTGTTSDELRRKFAAQEAQTLQSRQANEEFAKSFGRITYNYRQSADAASALADEALAANRNLSEMAGVGKVIYDATGKISVAPEILGRIRAQAEALGTIGGPDALRDQFERMGAVVARLSTQTPEQLGRLTGALGALGKGLRPEQATEAQQSVMAGIFGDTKAAERFMRSAGELKKGETITDEYGQIKDPAAVMAAYQRAWRKNAGSMGEAKRLARMYFGDIGGAAFMRAQFEQVGDVAPSGGAHGAAEALRKSEEGKRAGAQLGARGAQGDMAAHLLPIVDTTLNFAGAHPLAAGAAALTVPGLAAHGVSGIIDAIGSALGRGSSQIAQGGAAAGASMAAGGRAAGASLTSASSVLGKATGALAALAAGWAVGTALDEHFGISDELSGTRHEDFLPDKQLDDATLNKDVTNGRASRKAGRAGVMGELVNKFQKTGYDKGRFARLYDKSARADAGGDAGQLRMIEALETGTLNAQGLRPETEDMIIKALEKANLHVAVINKTGGPVEAISEQNADASGAQ